MSPPVTASIAAAAFMMGLAGADASAATPAPHWNIVTQSEPTYLKAGPASEAYRVIVRNDGAAPTSRASRVEITDLLPLAVVGSETVPVRATRVEARASATNGQGIPSYQVSCPSGEAVGTVTCSYEENSEQGALLPGATIVITVTIAIPPAAGQLTPNPTARYPPPPAR